MPELPEVETVKNSLKKKVINKIITDIKIYYDKIVEFPDIDTFKKQIKNQKINDVKRRGKWLLFELDNYYLLSHLRMEGKYFFRNLNDKMDKHEHISFVLDNNEEMRYHDTRKFGRMYLLEKEKAFKMKPLNELGKEPWDEDLNVEYLKEKLKNKQIPIKTVLLDQSIIVGIGNIYVDEVLFMIRLNPLIKGKDVDELYLQKIIDNTKIVLEKAIKLGGTTIKSYTSSEGVHGRFQNELLIHTKEKCPECNRNVTKIKIGGRGTYYCENCQK